MAARRCPMCHTANEPRAWRCTCGYEFGQSLEKARELLLDQLTTSRVRLWSWIVFDLAVIGGIVAAAFAGVIVFPTIGLVLTLAATIRAANKLAITRESLRSIERQQPQLPAAIVVKS